jgi:hypothetical protein
MSTKSIQITGSALEGMHGGSKKRGSRKKMSGGAQVSAPAPVDAALVAKPVADAALVADATVVAKPVPVDATLVAKVPVPAPMKGGAKPKVVLEPPSKKPLAKLDAPKKQQTRKARKIRVSLSGLSRRITRHKVIQKEAHATPIDNIKKKLIEAKLIKDTSKAPETMLRQIYADYQTLKNKAL